MADVTRVPGVWEQIWLVAGLRWRILCNSLRKKNNQWDLIGMIVAGLFGALFIFGLAVAFFFGGYAFASDGRESWFALLFWLIFLFWQLFPIFTAGFGAAFEFRSLLRFPLSQRAFYIVSLAYGFSDFGAVAALCWLIAMTLGAAIASPSLLPTLLIVFLLFVLMNDTLGRTLSSWLERILARRRARELFFGLFILFVISVQFISPALRRYGHSAQSWLGHVLPYLAGFPPALAGRALAGAAHSSLADIWIGEAGLLGFLLFFTALLWLRLASQYRGEELSETTAAARPVARAIPNTAAESAAFRFLTPQVAAVLRKEFRYLTRNTFAFFLLIMPPAIVLLFTTQFAGNHPTALKHPLSTEMFFPGMMAYLILILMSPAYNSFAYEGRGIQAYFTAPVSFREVFLGKNLLQSALVVFELGISVAAFSYIVGLPSLPVLVATAAGIVFIVTGQLTIANWSSLSFPRKLSYGRIGGQRQSGMAALASLASQILTGAIAAPILFLARWTGNAWLPAEVFTFLAVATTLGYASALDPLARLAEQKKETLIDALSR
ncbi:MAG TPA: hypothetical protein VJN42_10140 [Candidatus Acidoferrum sp.]|nr:hypothetical protein [Candidatus Acidoferrum sp.]